jgi:hypothetical protein|tara:strand:+ start:278 stop:568 length:291 start_codon:yes stop_codon:yes gene_type:complete
MQWFSHTELSGADFELLHGTELLRSMLHNKLVIVVAKPSSGNARLPVDDIGLVSCVGLYYIRPVAKSKHTFEILFEFESDLVIVDEHLTLYKLKQD